MPINVAIVGVGNCAKSLLEGIAYYSREGNLAGVCMPMIGRYAITDIDFVVAFDVDSRKVGLTLRDAISATPNRTEQLSDPLHYEATVKRGPTLDSIIPEMREYYIHESDMEEVDVVQELIDVDADVVVSYLPTGSDRASYAYSEAALKAGCSFINCMPTVLARDLEWQRRFAEAGLVLLGDDIKSQCGATILNRAILRLLSIRGVSVTCSEQVNYGGNSDHFNLQFRGAAKTISKESALNSVLDENNAISKARMIFTEENYDHKRAEISIEGRIFGNSPVKIHVTLENEDSPNSAGMVVDAIRASQHLVDTHRVDLIHPIAALMMKAPAKQYPDDVAERAFKEILNGNSMR